MAVTAKKILVVDDEPDAVAGITAMLEADGYSVGSASDGEAGLAAARKERPDLILLDIQMPGSKGGFETFTELRQDDSMKNIPVIFVTGVGERTGIHFSAEEIKDYLGPEPEGYIEKPVDAKRLLKTIKKVLGA